MILFFFQVQIVKPQPGSNIALRVPTFPGNQLMNKLINLF